MSLHTLQLFPTMLGPLSTLVPFLLSNCSPANLFSTDLLYKFNATVHCNDKSIFSSLLSDQISNLLLSLVETHLDLNVSEEMSS